MANALLPAVFALARIDVLAIDDWAMAPLSEPERRDFLESAKIVIKCDLRS